MTSKSNDACSRCTRGEGEEFRCFRGRYKLDVDLAREFVADGRETWELDSDDLWYSINHCEVNEGHIAHVDPSIPGIVAHIFFPDEDGTLIHCHRLIDGHHRASRCLQLGIPFLVYVLSEAESVEVLTRAPEGARPRITEQNLLEAVAAS